MIARRQVLGALLGAFGAACGAPSGGAKAPPASGRLDLDPLVDLIPAAGLVWLVEVRPKEVLASPALATLVAAAVPDDRLDAFAARHGGVDLRRADQVAVANHGPATLALARVPVDGWRVEAAFTARATAVEGRTTQGAVTRLWGTVGDHREQVAIFGGAGVGLEYGGLGPLEAAVYFAEGRLKRSLPALRASPLEAAAAFLGEAPVRAFAPGPFVGEWAEGLSGLMGGATALAARVLPGDRGALHVRLLLTGGWAGDGGDASVAANRLAASFRLLSEDPLGRLTGLDRPLEDPVATVTPDALALDVTLDAVTMSRGVRAATSASLAEIMAF